MKISIIGAGNVGGLTALRLAQENLGEIVLVDIAPGLAKGKILDLADARALVKSDYHIFGSEDFSQIKGSDIVINTAGLPRKPGMTREDLLYKNSRILKDVCLKIKAYAPEAILIVVTNPLDLMARYALKATAFKAHKVIGMGISLDSARFTNLIAEELKLSPLDIDACVIGVHGEGMLPLPRLTTVKGESLEKFLDQEKIADLIKRTIGRGLEIVTLLGSGSAYFAPSAAIAEIVRAIAKDEKSLICISAYLDGQYGLNDIFLGVPCRLGRSGIEEVIELKLEEKEKQLFLESASRLKSQFSGLAA